MATESATPGAATGAADSSTADPEGSIAVDGTPAVPMVDATLPSRGSLATIARLSRSPYALWGAFVLVHVVLWLCALLGAGMPLGDVTIVYLPWAQQAQHGYAFMGITAPWVYPALAMVPILIPLLAGADNYVVAWLATVTLFDVIAFAVLTARGRRRPVIAAWWWLAFLLLLGPIAVGRLDAVSVAIVIVALVWLSARPRTASVLLAAAMWIKVWPAGIVLAVVVASRRRWRVVSWVLLTSAVIALVAIAFGGAMDLFSFITQQTGRGLQIEAPISAPWLWAAALHVHGSFIYYDQQLLTFQVMGSDISPASAAMTPALAVAVIAVTLIGVRAVLRKAPTALVLPQLSLAIVAALIAFNKVGSPQYIDWLAAPVILGIMTAGRRFRTPAILVAITAGLTQLFYPYLYQQVLELNAWVLAVVTVRNVMLFVVLGWAVVALWRSDRHSEPLRRESADAASGGQVWPLGDKDATTAPSARGTSGGAASASVVVADGAPPLIDDLFPTGAP